MSSRASFSDAPAFYEPSCAKPATHVVPMLLSELSPLRADEKLLLQQEIGPYRSLLSRHRSRFNPIDAGTISVPPTPSLITTRRISVRFESPSLSSGSTFEASVPASHNARLIPKPEGEAGRPGRGGYNLRSAMGMSKKQYQIITNFTQQKVRDVLNVSQCFTLQSESAIKTVVDMVLEKFPDMNKYEEVWPVTDVIRLYLKYTAARSKSSAKTNAAPGPASASS